MRIEQLTLQQVGPFKKEKIEFQPIPNGEKKAEIHVLTGANGSGKSTILYLISSLFWKNNPSIEYLSAQDQNIEERLWDMSFESYYKVLIRDGYEFSMGGRLEVNKQLHEDQISVQKYINVQRQDKIKEPIDFAVFGYSGYRNFTENSVETIKELSSNPLKEALIFNKKINGEVNQWIANMIAKEAIALQKKQTTEAAKYRTNLSALENLLSELLGQSVQFEIETNPTQVILNKNGTPLSLAVLPDGLKSIISWVGDLLMRLDRIPWKDNLPITQRRIILFLDEIEVHLHPKWQMKVLPLVQKLFTNAQIFVSTHSPFVVNSVDDAWIYKLILDENGHSYCNKPILSETGKSYRYVLDEIFDVDEEFGLETEQLLDQFYQFRDQVLASQNIDNQAFEQLIKQLNQEGEEVRQIVGSELRQINRITQMDYAL